ncbi:hypothetical protein PHO31112_02231 [Pandoraea horticolens]|uniref:Uncharacterized protein n=1 Tax=Pandoraea horticolens TaxID=2508298 RepID=A0A5E4UWN1_9BURK|nr:hypothetical protein [Pandoraea horticolens]VVE02940.1 hypothetical protein PHO31112_02231 [Pandoraea horticolens]
MRTLLAIATAALLSASALAQTAPTAAADQDHAAHHPADVSASAPSTPPTKAGPKAASKRSKAASAPSTAQMDAMMKSMQEMHDKMMAARTPEERQALMNEHMKTMQEGMSMMGQMHGGKGTMGPGGGMGTGTGPDAMNKRMDMMEMMMQMMMDREVTRSSSPAK